MMEDRQARIASIARTLHHQQLVKLAPEVSERQAVIVELAHIYMHQPLTARLAANFAKHVIIAANGVTDPLAAPPLSSNFFLSSIQEIWA